MKLSEPSGKRGETRGVAGKRLLLLALPFLLVGVLIVYVMGSFSAIVLWSSLPVAVAYLVLAIGLHFQRPVAAVTFTAVAAGLGLPALFVYLAMLFWGGLGPGNTRAAWLLIVFPTFPLACAVFAAGIASGIAWFFTARRAWWPGLNGKRP